MELESYNVTITSVILLRTAYYTVYREVYSMDWHTVHKCCPGWTQRGEEVGCLHSKCSHFMYITLFDILYKLITIIKQRKW